MRQRAWDDSGVDRVLAYFDDTPDEQGRLARTLLDRGGTVVEAWGPVQMAVYHLVIRHGSWDVTFHSERGYREWVSIRRAAASATHEQTHRPLGLAVLAWARAHDAPFRLEEPADISHDLAAYGPDALDWLDSGNESALERLYRVWVEDRQLTTAPKIDERDPSRVKEALPRLEAAAVVTTKPR